MPWYWSDDIAKILIDSQRLDPKSASSMVAAPVAFRRVEPTLEEAADRLMEDDEIPLAA
jgi:hypothetical protein